MGGGTLSGREVIALLISANAAVEDAKYAMCERWQIKSQLLLNP